MSDEVPNRYREELERALRHERFRATVTSELLDTVRDALANGAWQSTAADVFDAENETHRMKLVAAADHALEVLQTRHRSEPHVVPVGDWRARFQG